MKTPHQKRVEKFMRLARQEVKDKPELPDENVLRLRASLILEECLETIEALGCECIVAGSISANKDNVQIVSSHEANLIEICDGAADSIYVLTGCLSACGIDDKGLQELVDNNNLEKFNGDYSFNAQNKLIKPKTHTPPDIKAYLDSLKK